MQLSLSLCHGVLQNNNKSTPFCTSCGFSSIMQVYIAETDLSEKTNEWKLVSVYALTRKGICLFLQHTFTGLQKLAEEVYSKESSFGARLLY